jgi:hypothetical protein
MVGLTDVVIALVEIFLVGSVVVALTTWPLWRRLKKLERERDAKAREILERWGARRPRSRGRRPAALRATRCESLRPLRLQ